MEADALRTPKNLYSKTIREGLIIHLGLHENWSDSDRRADFISYIWPGLHAKSFLRLRRCLPLMRPRQGLLLPSCSVCSLRGRRQEP